MSAVGGFALIFLMTASNHNNNFELTERLEEQNLFLVENLFASLS